MAAGSSDGGLVALTVSADCTGCVVGCGVCCFSAAFLMGQVKATATWSPSQLVHLMVDADIEALKKAQELGIGFD